MRSSKSPNLDYDARDERVLTLKNLQTNDPAFVERVEWARRIAATECRVLIVGESGTGKTRMARAIHLDGPRADRRLVTFDLTGMSPGEVETDLRDLAHGSCSLEHNTVLIEGLFDQPESVISRVLRINEPFSSARADVRLILTCTVEDSKPSPIERLPHALAHRLPEAVIEMPALRNRSLDASWFLGQFVEEADWRYGCAVEDWAPEVEELLLAYPWPGNLHELRRVAHAAVLRAKGKLLSAADMEPLLGPVGGKPVEASRRTLSEVAQEYVARVLAQEKGNVCRAAEVLGIHRSTVGEWKRKILAAAEA